MMQSSLTSGDLPFYGIFCWFAQVNKFPAHVHRAEIWPLLPKEEFLSFIPAEPSALTLSVWSSKEGPDGSNWWPYRRSEGQHGGPQSWGLWTWSGGASLGAGPSICLTMRKADRRSARPPQDSFQMLPWCHQLDCQTLRAQPEGRQKWKPISSLTSARLNMNILDIKLSCVDKLDKLCRKSLWILHIPTITGSFYGDCEVFMRIKPTWNQIKLNFVNIWHLEARRWGEDTYMKLCQQRELSPKVSQIINGNLLALGWTEA